MDNVIQRAFILHIDGVITAEDIPMEIIVENMQNMETLMPDSNTAALSTSLPAAQPKKTASSCSANLNDELRGREFDKILEILQSTMGNRKMAAEQLGISQRTLRYKLARMRDNGISVPGGFGVKTA